MTIHKTLPDIKPMLASPPKGERLSTLAGTHIFDIKLDGVRAIFYWDGTAARIVNRSGRDRTDVYPDLVAGCPRVNSPYVLDGEIVATTGKFSDIARRDKQSKYADVNRVMCEVPAQFIAFDFLHGDEDIRGWRYADRRLALEGFSATWDDRLPFVTSVVSTDPAFFEIVREQGMEGVIAKRMNSTYRSGRFGDWIKFKTTQSVTCVATGYEPGIGARKHFGAMFLHMIDANGQPVAVGKVGTGFTHREIDNLKAQLDAGTPLVVEIECLNVSKDGILRFPVYKGLRTDLSVLDATLSQLDNVPRC